MSRKSRNPIPDPSPESKEPRGRRAQKPGAPGTLFYARNRNRNTRKRFARARKLHGLDHEITAFRMRLRELIVTEPGNYALIFKTFELLIRAYNAKIRASRDSKDADDTAVIDALREAADTLGLDRVPWSQADD